MSYLVANHEDRSSCDEADIFPASLLDVTVHMKYINLIPIVELQNLPVTKLLTFLNWPKSEVSRP